MGAVRNVAALILLAGCSGDPRDDSAATGGAGGVPNPPGTDAATGGRQSSTADTQRLFFLDFTGRVLSAAIDGSDLRVLVSGVTTGPDGIAVDVDSNYLYWTNMGGADVDDGTIQRARLDGSEVTTIVASGGTFTPKQLRIDWTGRKLYWSDREGMRVMRANLDGSAIETLVTVAEGSAARADAANWCVGIAVDPEKKHVYWTQKGPDDGGRGSIRRAGLEIPPGQDSRTRSDIEVLFEALPEPIDLELDPSQRTIYWTDRGDNTVNRAATDLPAGVTARTRGDREVLVRSLGEAIGLALDLDHGAMYFTGLDGRLGTSGLDGSGATFPLSGQGLLTGIAHVVLPR
jgi:DNA-binding beta-propeller fold protein YncE